MKTFVLPSLILFLILPCFSQKVPVKFGRISQEEIELSSYENADAVILCDYGTIQLDGKTGNLYLYRFRHLRIKILTEEGLKYARQSIPFYDLKAADRYEPNPVYELKAQTINISRDGKIIKSRLKGKNEQVGEADKVYNNVLELNFPNVRVGSILEYEINIPTIEIVNPDIWYFQQPIPVMHSELRILCPENVNYKVKTYNGVLDIAETTYQHVIVGYRSGSRTYNGYQIRLVKENIPAADTDLPVHERIHQKIMLEYTDQQNVIPGIETLFKATDPNYKFKDRSAKMSTLTNSSYILYREPSMESLPEKMLKDREFGPPLSLPYEIDDTIKSLTADCNDRNEKLEIIYNYICKHMSWNGAFRTSVNRSSSRLTQNIMAKTDHPNLNTSLIKPFERQEGTNAEINFILINALRRAGFNANPILTSTKDNGSLDPEFFNLHQFNHVLALVELEGNEILLDAVQNEEGASMLANQEIFPVGLVIKEKEAYWINLHDQDN